MRIYELVKKEQWKLNNSTGVIKFNIPVSPHMNCTYSSNTKNMHTQLNALRSSHKEKSQNNVVVVLLYHIYVCTLAHECALVHETENLKMRVHKAKRATKIRELPS